MQDADAQLDIFGDAIPVEHVPHVCTRDENCQADVDRHDDDCPVERRLRETFGF